MVGWLFLWPPYWLTGFSVSWLVKGLVGLSVGWLVGWLVVWLVGWLVGQLIGWLETVYSCLKLGVDLGRWLGWELGVSR